MLLRVFSNVVKQIMSIEKYDIDPPSQCNTQLALFDEEQVATPMILLWTIEISSSVEYLNCELLWRQCGCEEQNVLSSTPVKRIRALLKSAYISYRPFVIHKVVKAELQSK